MEKFPYISMVNFKASLVVNQCLPFRSSRWQMFLKAGVLKSYAISAVKQLRWSLFFKYFQSFRSATILKRNSNKSSGIYKVIRPVLNFLFIFFMIRFHKYKKALKSTKSTTNILIFFRIGFRQL